MNYFLTVFLFLITSDRNFIVSQETHLASYSTRCSLCDLPSQAAHSVLSNIMFSLDYTGKLYCNSVSNSTVCKESISFSNKVVGLIRDCFPRGWEVEDWNTRGLACVMFWRNCYERTKNGTATKSCIACERTLHMAHRLAEGITSAMIDLAKLLCKKNDKCEKAVEYALSLNVGNNFSSEIKQTCKISECNGEKDIELTDSRPFHLP